MSISPMDLDSSLDDLIKKRKQKPHNKRTPSNSNRGGGGGSGERGRDKRASHPYERNRPKSSVHDQLPRAKITKPSQIQRTSSGINFRLSTPSSSQKVSGPLFTSKNQPQQQQQQQQKRAVVDPSQIVITKAIPASTPSLSSSLQSRISGGSFSQSRTQSANREPSSILNGRLGKQPIQQQQPPVSQPIETSIYRPRPPTTTPMATTQQPPMNNFAIRGRSVTAASTSGLSIKGESGPTLVLVSGLDPGANDDDLKFAFEEFGNILRCEVLRKRDGTSFGEAEVEFSTKSAALDCIARLDNQLADGRYLRVILRENKPKPSYASPKPLQSVISTPSYTPSGKMYSDQITSRYDIRRP